MAINAAHVSVASNGDIRWTGASETYTVLELHRFLQDLADDAAASGDDIVDITSDTPSERSTDNIITLLGSYNIDDEMAEHLYDGSITQTSGDTQYSGLVVVGSVFSSTTLKIVQDNTFYDHQEVPFWGTNLNADAAANILMRCMVKTRDGGADIDGKRIRVQARVLGDTYAEFSVTMGLGNSVAAIFTNEDLNNTTGAGTISGWPISNTEGYQLIDIDNGNGDRPYYSKWALNSQTINDLYEYTKWVTRSNTSESIHSMNGELFRGITHEWNYDGETVNFQEDEELTWDDAGTTGTGSLLALDDNGATGTIWIQLLAGSAPSDDTGISGSTSGGRHLVNGSVTSRTISPAFIGTSTGTALIGAFGIGVTATDLSDSDILFDLTNTQQTPPNFVTFTVSGVVSGSDRVLVGPKDVGSAIDFDQLGLLTLLNGAAETQVSVSSIPADTPSTGTIRVLTTTGSVYQRVPYTSWQTGAFAISESADFSGDYAESASNVWISYIDITATTTSATFTTKYNADRSLYVRVRDGGSTPIKTFETPATLTNAGGSVAAIRTSDE